MRYVYVTVALLAWAALAFVYRWAEGRRVNRYGMSLAMGLTTALLALGYALASQIDLRLAGGSQAGAGACQGAIQVVLIPIFMAAVARGDLSITWTVLTLSFSLAAALAMGYPGEHPTTMGLSGLVLAGVAVAMLGLDMVHRSRGPDHRRPQKGWLPLVAVSFVLNGLALYTYSVADGLKPDRALADDLVFIVAAGLVFGMGSLVMVLLRRQPGGLGAGLVGGVVGGALIFVGALMTLQALSAGVPGHIVYPATTGGSSLLVVVLSVILLKERPGWAGWSGILAGLAALVLFALATAPAS
ncbi:MAG: hypothetical protein GWP05_00670 [Anaerolineaceae bacterium]|nr:hypothetical protein [Anaerolineaceae bacterium]